MEKLLAFAMLAIVVGGCSSLGGNKVPDVKVLNVEELQKDYRASIPAARTKYEGKEFIVIGRAGDPIDDNTLKTDDKKYIYYDIREDGGGMTCFVPVEDRAKFDGFKPNDVIAVKGIMHIEEGNYNLKPCTREFRDKK